jgi:cell fate regulator YaaT (PSP1 superfamily)
MFFKRQKMENYNFYGRGCKNLSLDSKNDIVCSSSGCNKLDTFNWLSDIPAGFHNTDLVEVRFKNTRKAIFKNVNNLRIEKGDIVAVEASPGHDIGVVSLTGALVIMKLKLNNVTIDYDEVKKIYRKAKQADIDKWKKAISLEHSTMLKARKFAEDLKLEMKIGDVEYQGDMTKAIFYYIADDRVDFRELIKILANEFKVRIEMRQIGARQEAGRIGGIGACGRELCCSAHITSFVSVTTSSARYQEISLNPQKLAGQCSKLKCCLNYELNVYLDAQKDFPDTSVPLNTENGPAYHQKTDVFNRLMWYSYDQESASESVCLSIDTVKEIIKINSKGEKVAKLENYEDKKIAPIIDYHDGVDEESLSRFEDKS